MFRAAWGVCSHQVLELLLREFTKNRGAHQRQHPVHQVSGCRVTTAPNKSCGFIATPAEILGLLEKGWLPGFIFLFFGLPKIA
jgi:hypothetical protein